MSSPVRVLVSFPTAPSMPYLHKKVVEVSWRILSDRRYAIEPILPSHNPYENNQNQIVQHFLRSNCDFWLSIDNDNPPTGNPLDRVPDDKDIIGFPTPVWHFRGDEKPGERPIYWNGYVRSENWQEEGYKENQNREGLVEVDAIGTGCFLIARRVFEHPDMQRGAFLRQYDEKGIVHKGNDISFCERAKDAGFHIFCDYDRPCDHFNELSLNELVTAFKRLYE